MAVRIPVYEQQTQVGGTPNVRLQARDAGPEAAAGALAKGLQGLATASAAHDQAANRETAKASTSELKSAVTRFRAASQNLLYSTEQGNEGALRQQGKAALEHRERYIKAFDESAKSIGATLTDPAVRAAFEQKAQEEGLGFSRMLETHIGKQIDAEREETHEALVEQSVRSIGDLALQAAETPEGKGEELPGATQGDARLFWDNMRNDRMGELEDAIKIRGQQEGWKQPKIDDAIQDAKTVAHEGAVRLLMSQGHEKAAKEYFEAHEDELDTDTRAELGPVVDKAVRTQELQTKESLLNETYDNEQEVADAIRRQTDDGQLTMDEANEVISMHETRVTQEKRARIANDDPHFEAFRNRYFVQKNYSRPTEAEMAPLTDKGKADVQVLWETQQRRRRQERKARRAGGGEKTALKARLRAVIAEGGGLEDIDLNSGPWLEAGEKEGFELREILGKAKTRRTKQVSDTAFERMLKHAWAGSGRSGGRKQYENAMRAQYEVWMDENGDGPLKAPPRDEVKEWSKFALSAHVYPDRWGYIDDVEVGYNLMGKTPEERAKFKQLDKEGNIVKKGPKAPKELPAGMVRMRHKETGQTAVGPEAQVGGLDPAIWERVN